MFKDFVPPIVRREAKKSLNAEPKVFREFSLISSSQEESFSCIANCLRALNEIKNIWDSVALLDTDEFYHTIQDLTFELQFWINNPRAISVNEWRHLQMMMIQYKQILMGLKSDLVSSPLTKENRRKLSVLNADIQQEFYRIIDISHEPEINESQSSEKIDEEKTKQRVIRTLEKINSPEGREIWSREFAERHVNFVHATTFMRVLRNYFEITSDSDERMIKSILDPYHTGHITPKAFGDFLIAFGPLKESLSNLKSLFKYSWFRPFLSTEESSWLLNGQPPGTFLVRLSKSESGSFALEYVTKANTLLTSLIKSSTTLTLEIDNGLVLEAKTLEEMIKKLEHTLTRPFRSEYDDKRWFHGEISEKQVQEKLENKPPGTYMVHFHPSSFGSLLCSFVNKAGEISRVEINKTAQGGFMKRKYFDEEGSASKTSFSSLTTVYKDVDEIINTHNNQLKYNYSEDGVPTVEVEPYIHLDQPLFVLQAPIEDKTPNVVNEGVVVLRTRTTYPDNPPNQGFEIICDVLRSTNAGNRIIAVVADGCGWGRHSRKAAEEGSKAVLDYLTAVPVQEKITDTYTCSSELLSSFYYAHEQVVKTQLSGKVGLTTILAGMTIQIKSQFSNEDWAFVFASVGDCKAFHWSCKTGKVTDLCVGNRNNPHDARDCGGCIGPYNNNGEPDFRNLFPSFYPCKTGDVILMMSDGVHDNLDPESLGYQPQEIGQDWKTWTEGEKKAVERVKSALSCRKVEEIFSTVKNPGPIDFTRVLLEYTVELTSAKRTYMATKLQPEPDISKDFPGKMDHASILAFVVGDLIESKKDSSRDSTKRKEKKEKDIKKPLLKPFWKKDARINIIKPITVITPTPENEDPLQAKMKELLPNFTYMVVCPWDYSNSLKFNSKRPCETKLMKLNEDVAGWTVSTYPNTGTKEFPIRINDPIANFYNILLTPGRHTFVLTTGVGYGQNFMSSAATAATEFNSYVEKCQIKIKDTQKAAEVLLKAINQSQKAIIQASVDTFETGIMLLGGVALRLPSLEENRSQWAIVCANIGDNRLFYWNYNQKKLLEMSKVESNMLGSDPGRIGSIPDIRNLKLHFQPCDENEKDILILMSATTFYNFDPENLGVNFKEVATFQKWKKYSRVPYRIREEEILSNIEKKLQLIKDPNPVNFVQEIISTVRKVTKPKRLFLTTNANDEQAKGYTRLYGKMGHATCIALRIGDFVPSLNILSSADTESLAISSETMTRIERNKALKQSMFNKFHPEKNQSPTGTFKSDPLNED